MNLAAAVACILLVSALPCILMQYISSRALRDLRQRLDAAERGTMSADATERDDHESSRGLEEEVTKSQELVECMRRDSGKTPGGCLQTSGGTDAEAVGYKRRTGQVRDKTEGHADMDLAETLAWQDALKDFAEFRMQGSADAALKTSEREEGREHSISLARSAVIRAGDQLCRSQRDKPQVGCDARSQQTADGNRQRACSGNCKPRSLYPRRALSNGLETIPEHD